MKPNQSTFWNAPKSSQVYHLPNFTPLWKVSTFIQKIQEVDRPYRNVKRSLHFHAGFEPSTRASTAMTVAKKRKLKNIEEEEDEDSVGKWFLQFTSVGGLSQLGQSKFLVSKIAWFLLLIFGVFMTIYMCIGIYGECMNTR